MANVQDRGPPSTAAVAVATAIVAALAGYYLGQARTIGLFGDGSKSRSHPTSFASGHPQLAEESDLSDVDSESGDVQQPVGELNSFADSSEECKLVLVVRTDLGMRHGKIAAQCSHATLACYRTILRSDPAHPILRQWERLGQAKVAVKIDNEEEMLLLQAQAMSLGLCAQVIHDAGRTQVASGSATVLGVGPGPKSVVDQVTKHLKLL